MEIIREGEFALSPFPHLSSPIIVALLRHRHGISHLEQLCTFRLLRVTAVKNLGCRQAASCGAEAGCDSTSVPISPILSISFGY